MEQLLDLVRQYLPDQILTAVLTAILGTLMAIRGIRQLFESWSDHRLTMQEMRLKETLAKDAALAPYVPFIVASQLGDAWDPQRLARST